MKLRLLRRCLAGVSTLFLAFSAMAAIKAVPVAPAASPNRLPPLLASLVAHGQLKVISEFPTEVPGLTGYLVSSKGSSEVVYGEHGYLFVGHLISPQGHDLTDDYQDRFRDYGAVVRKLESDGHLISEGRANAPLLYVFADPNCIFCYHFYRMAEPLVAAGRLHLRWVIVGFLKSDSLARATTILSAHDPRTALHADEDRFDTAHEAGGVPPSRSSDKTLQGVLQTHLAAMDAVGGVGTPTLLYRDQHGHWAAQVGLPSSEWLTAYAGGKPLPGAAPGAAPARSTPRTPPG